MFWNEEIAISLPKLLYSKLCLLKSDFPPYNIALQFNRNLKIRVDFCSPVMGFFAVFQLFSLGPQPVGSGTKMWKILLLTHSSTRLPFSTGSIRLHQPEGGALDQRMTIRSAQNLASKIDQFYPIIGQLFASFTTKIGLLSQFSNLTVQFSAAL